MKIVSDEVWFFKYLLLGVGGWFGLLYVGVWFMFCGKGNWGVLLMVWGIFCCGGFKGDGCWVCCWGKGFGVWSKS